MVKVSQFDNFGVEDMSKEEYMTMQDKVVGKCLCAKCPSYVKGDEPVGFCFPMMGSSNVIQREKGCLCTTCPVYSDYELTHTYYCTRCSQVCQAYKVELGGGHE